MSNNPIVSKEKLSAYRPWELNSFNQGDVQKAAHAQIEKKKDLDQHAYQRGRTDGRAEGVTKTQSDAQNLHALLASIGKQGEEIKQGLADDLIELALEIARRMVHDALEVRSELIVPIVQDALAHLARPLGQSVLAVHPLDAAIVREHLGHQLAADGWKIIEEANIERGGCRLQTLASQTDATIGCRWQRLAAALGKSAPWIKS
jgi:flagellar assembly protein FliH